MDMDSSSSSSAATAATAGVVAASTHRYSYNPSLIWNPEVEEYFIKAYGANHFARISESLTRPSSYSCIRVNILKLTTYAVFEKLTKLLREGFADGFDVMSTERLPEGNENDEGFQNGICQGIFKLCLEGTCEDREKKENIVKRHGIYECQLPGLDYILFVRGSGPHHILYGNQLNRCLKEVIVSRKCAESVLRGAQVFVPGVLACSSHVEKGDVVAVSVAIEQPNTGGWGVGITRGAVLQGSETDPQYLERKGMYIGQGITQLSRAGIFRASEGVAVEMTNRVYRLPSFHDLLKGEIFLQNLPSIIAAHVLGPL
ncbi:hypothetical protein HPP92_023130 [Vanilla planifolia]|uniref:PUA domain-containing protein n=1 Tax=Vanilla planifolia TaxID=51239 RepID=A0A835Q1Z4_VANPL|nr:hypothetical protein HPP92_023130 [Vanilla planifolia]